MAKGQVDANDNMMDTITTCPACERHRPRAEFQNHRGVCAKCHRAFDRAHRTAVNGTRLNRMQFTTYSKAEAAAQHDWAWDGEHEKISVEHHPHDPTRPAEVPETERDAALHGMAEAMREVLVWIFRDSSDKLHKPTTALARAATLAALLQPEILDSKSFQQIGAWAGNLTKACVSKHAVDFQRAFQVKFRRTRPESAHATFAEAARQAHARRRAATTGQTQNGNGETH